MGAEKDPFEQATQDETAYLKVVPLLHVSPRAIREVSEMPGDWCTDLRRCNGGHSDQAKWPRYRRGVKWGDDCPRGGGRRWWVGKVGPGRRGGECRGQTRSHGAGQTLLGAALFTTPTRITFAPFAWLVLRSC